jgi:hypothetical protein
MGSDIPLNVLDSRYRSPVRPVLTDLEAFDSLWDNAHLAVGRPEFVAATGWHHVLHNPTALLITGALLVRTNQALVSVPYRLETLARHQQHCRDRRGPR